MKIVVCRVTAHALHVASCNLFKQNEPRTQIVIVITKTRQTNNKKQKPMVCCVIDFLLVVCSFVCLVSLGVWVCCCFVCGFDCRVCLLLFCLCWLLFLSRVFVSVSVFLSVCLFVFLLWLLFSFWCLACCARWCNRLCCSLLEHATCYFVYGVIAQALHSPSCNLNHQLR